MAGLENISGPLADILAFFVGQDPNNAALVQQAIDEGTLDVQERTLPECNY